MRNLELKATAIVVGIALIILGIFHQTYDFSDKNPGPEVQIIIPNGASGSSIGDLLFTNNVIKSKKFFVEYYINNKAARGISPGVHKIQSKISTKLAVQQLLDQKRVISAINVREGSTYSDVLKALRENSHIISEKIQVGNLRIPLSNRSNSIEGQILPAIYSFEPGTRIIDALNTMLSRFSESTLPRLKKYKNFNPYQVLTIASMVQIEGDVSDFSKVARVIYNRLAINMPLQLNSSVQYAANLRGRIALSVEATKINSPYNTYRNIGLPPTPISNPSNAAISATLKPAEGDWLYFITVKPGDTRFTKDFKEFQTWNSEYNKNLANGLFK